MSLGGELGTVKKRAETTAVGYTASGLNARNLESHALHLRRGSCKGAATALLADSHIKIKSWCTCREPVHFLLWFEDCGCVCRPCVKPTCAC